MLVNVVGSAVKMLIRCVVSSSAVKVVTLSLPNRLTFFVTIQPIVNKSDEETNYLKRHSSRLHKAKVHDATVMVEAWSSSDD